MSSSTTIDPAFATRLQEYGHCDLLIDRMIGFPLQEELQALGGQAESLPLNDPLFATMPDQAPLLVRLSADATDLIEGYLAHAVQEAQNSDGQTRAVCAVLLTRTSLSMLRKRLTRLLDLRIKTGKRVYFRYFDPRVMHHLPRLLQPSEMAQLFQGIDYWCYVHWRGHLVMLNAADYGPLPDVPAYVRISIGRVQWEALQDIEIFNLALRILRQSGYPADEQTEAILHAAIRLTHMHSLEVPADQATLACHIVCSGDAILHQPQWRRALQLTREHGIPLKDCLETINIALLSPSAVHE